MDGIINVFKESGYTSNDVVQVLRGILKTKRVGHGGTLDPAVTGVLPVAVGKATRLLEYMDGDGKVYEGALALGVSTETEDGEGAVVERSAVSQNLTEEQVDTAMLLFLGKIQQVPPMYSAVKVNGRRLYEYARASQTVERPMREVEITEFRRLSPIRFEETSKTASLDFRVACSKGTYVRTLCVDLAASLGYPGHMSHLRRTMANGLKVEQALKLSEIEEVVKSNRLSEILQPLPIAISGLARLNLTSEQRQAVGYGQSFTVDEALPEGPVALFYEDELLAIYTAKDNLLKAKKVLI